MTDTNDHIEQRARELLAAEMREHYPSTADRLLDHTRSPESFPLSTAAAIRAIVTALSARASAGEGGEIHQWRAKGSRAWIDCTPEFFLSKQKSLIYETRVLYTAAPQPAKGGAAAAQEWVVVDGRRYDVETVKTALLGLASDLLAAAPQPQETTCNPRATCAEAAPTSVQHLVFPPESISATHPAPQPQYPEKFDRNGSETTDAAAFLTHPAPQPQNQCDGCRAGDVADAEGFHRSPHMLCQKGRYTTTPAHGDWEGVGLVAPNDLARLKNGCSDVPLFTPKVPVAGFVPLYTRPTPEAEEARDADTKRLDWLEANEFDLVTRREDMGEDEYAIWWFIVDPRKSAKRRMYSISGHPLGSPREAIDAAMSARGEVKNDG